jgi:hypothetical protein
MDAGDLKKLVKADGYSKDAGDLMEEVNRINMQLLSAQGDSDINISSADKKYKQLEAQAWQKQVQASALYEKCNTLKFTTYKKAIEAFWSNHPGAETDFLNEKLLEEQASDNYFQAASYRIDAKRMKDGNPRIEKLTEANNLESEAIQKVLTALATCYDLQTATDETTAQEAVQAETVVSAPGQRKDSLPQGFSVPDSSGRLNINQDMIDMYNRYVNHEPLTDTTLSTGKLTGVTHFDSDNILELWYAYLYGRNGEESDVDLPAPENEITTPAVIQTPQQAVPSEQKDTEIGIVTDENRAKLVPADEEIIYRVQIAARRSELTQRALSRIYYGNKNVEMINENGWFKYSVGDFTDYEEANKFRKSSGISSAFVVAYRKGKVQLTQVQVTEVDTAVVSLPEATVQMVPSGLIFRIQVAASRVPLTLGQFARLYSGDYPVEMVEEDGWYKYQLMGVRLYSDAIRIIRDVKTKGVFIVAYKDGVKQNLAESVNSSLQMERAEKSHGKNHIQDIEFHLQLAASKVSLRSAEVAKLYNGPEKVSVVLDGGWYKYHLKAGNSIETAKSLKQKCGIDKAYIVPYRKAVKIGLFEALQEIK